MVKGQVVSACIDRRWYEMLFEEARTISQLWAACWALGTGDPWAALQRAQACGFCSPWYTRAKLIDVLKIYSAIFQGVPLLVKISERGISMSGLNSCCYPSVQKKICHLCRGAQNIFLLSLLPINIMLDRDEGCSVVCSKVVVSLQFTESSQDSLRHMKSSLYLPYYFISHLSLNHEFISSEADSAPLLAEEHKLSEGTIDAKTVFLRMGTGASMGVAADNEKKAWPWQLTPRLILEMLTKPADKDIEINGIESRCKNACILHTCSLQCNLAVNKNNVSPGLLFWHKMFPAFFVPLLPSFFHSAHS
ncbi:hypothetical protein EK904_014312 [Melospiza melodia maxima]|nr:hypothetical protein EK904_014312 [Melospiza melodia maxima]